jgi:pimeloyl-ACP methyl ester carboxylesterase
MAFFALFHGGAHGGWCWEDLVPELEARGHRTSAPDLPYDEPAGAGEWADTVIATIPDDAEHVVVVGHSLGGLAVPVVADRRPVDHMVFLGAMVPVPGRSMVDVMTDEPEAITVPGAVEHISGEGPPPEPDDAGDAVMSWALARQMFYDDLPEDVGRRAWQRLRTLGMTSFLEPCPIDAWPAVPSTYILMTGDQSVNPEWSRAVARGRLGADLVELPGGHSPFYGRPAELAEVLDGIAGGRS